MYQISLRLVGEKIHADNGKKKQEYFSDYFLASPFSKCVVERKRNKVNSRFWWRREKKNGLDPKTSPIPLKFLRSYCCKKV